MPGPVSSDGSGSCRNGSIDLTTLGSSIGLRVFSSCGNAWPFESSAARIAFSSPLTDEEGGNCGHRVRNKVVVARCGQVLVVELDEQRQMDHRVDELLGLVENSSDDVFVVSQ